MNLALFLNIAFTHDGQNYWADEHYFRFWTDLANYFEKVTLCVPVSNKAGNGKFIFVPDDRIGILHLPPNVGSISFGGIMANSNLAALIRENIHKWDIIGAVVPNPPGLIFLKYALLHKKPFFAYIRGNVRNTARYRNKGIRKVAAYMVVSLMDIATRKYINNGLAFVVGPDLLKIYRDRNRNVHQIIVSLLSKADIIPFREKTDRKRIHILHIGRLSGEKGVSFLLNAVHVLKEEKQRMVELSIIGDGPDESELRLQAREMGLSEVVFHGYIPYGEKTICKFSESDVFVLPSLTEGIPKVLLEAMANGVPIVASAVGGIPDLVRDEVDALLVPPKNIGAIVDAVIRIADDKELRNRLVENARQTVLRYTCESQQKFIIETLENRYSISIRRAQISK